MADFVTAELVRLCLSVAVGAGFAIVYDVFRVARRAVKHSYAAVSGEDIIFWLAAGVAAFFFFLFLDEGRLRLYTVLGIFAGITVYRLTLGRLLVPFFGNIIEKILKIATNLLKKVI
ncbi:MAG: spore cortex biosynthesis protein YabQ, partial [Butyrivibrio sp.]|nr:spore cortex biosynthesis protein YabQ [Butyrivibrio sp.]